VTYALIEENKRPFCISATLDGRTLKIDATSGSKIVIRDTLQHGGPNDGLIAGFSLGDLTGDGILDIVGSSIDHHIYCLNGRDLSVTWSFDTEEEHNYSCALYDVSGDGIPDVFCGTCSKRILVLDGASGKLLCQYSVTGNKKRTPHTIWLADVDGDGILNMVATSEDGEILISEVQAVKTGRYEIVWDRPSHL
jgi:hypothetical protein